MAVCGFQMLDGPILADRLTVYPNEHAAIWCLLSIALCVSVIKSPMSKHLHVRDSLFYDRLKPMEGLFLGSSIQAQEPCTESVGQD